MKKFQTRKALKAQIAALTQEVEQAKRQHTWCDYRTERTIRTLERTNPEALANGHLREILGLSALAPAGNPYLKEVK